MIHRGQGAALHAKTQSRRIKSRNNSGRCTTLKEFVATAEAIAAKAEIRALNADTRADEERDRADVERVRADKEREKAEALAARLTVVRANGVEQAAGFEKSLAELRTLVDDLQKPWPRVKFTS